MVVNVTSTTYLADGRRFNMGVLVTDLTKLRLRQQQNAMSSFL